MRPPRAVRRGRSEAQRWGSWVVLALLITLPALACQTATAASTDTRGTAPVALASCHGQLGHDVLCTQGITAGTPQSVRNGRYDDVREVIGQVVAAALLTAGSLVTLRMTARFALRTGPPSWAPRRLVTGRHQLVTIGISRI